MLPKIAVHGFKAAWDDMSKFIKILVIILAIFAIIAGLRQHNTQVVPTVEQAEHIAGVSLKKPAETAPIKTDIRHAVTVAKQEQDKNHSDVAPIVGNVDNLPPDKPVELKQYHVYNAPKILREVGVKLDPASKVRGISYSVSRRIDKRGRYIGLRAEYDWQDKQGSVWATYSY